MRELILANNIKKIRTILFDMDGVLINAKEWHYGALNKALVDFGYEPISHKDHIENFDGLPTRKKLVLLGKQQNIPESQFEDINTLKQKYTKTIANDLCYPTKYHVDALSRLHDDKYQMAVCSNSVRQSVKTMMTKANLMPFLSFYLSNEDVTSPKPSPEIYNTAMEKFSALPEETLILEDNKNGIKAALQSGAHLMKINDVEDVTYSNIIEKIKEIESRD